MERGELTGWPEDKPDLSAWDDSATASKQSAQWIAVADAEPAGDKTIVVDPVPAPAAPKGQNWVSPKEGIENTPTLKITPAKPTRQVPASTAGKPAARAAKPGKDFSPRDRSDPRPTPKTLVERYRQFQIAMLRASDHDVSVALQQLSVMLKAGINPTRAFAVLAEQSNCKAIRYAFDDIATYVIDRGWSFSDALTRHPNIFPAEVLLLSRAGEESGDLADRLMRASEMLERRYSLFCRVKQALTSPIITCIACAMVLFGITKFVLPRFLGLYDQMNAALPLVSKIVIGVVNVINSPAFLLLVIVLIVFAVIRRNWLQQRAFDFAVANPVTRYLVGSLLAAQFVDVLACMQRDGIPLQRGLQLMRKTSPFPQYSEQLSTMCQKLEQEGSLGEAIHLVPYFPRMVSSMVIVGEETGEMQDLLLASRRLLEQQNEVVLTQIVTVVEPVVIGLMGVAMGFLCVGMFLPIYGLLEKLAV